MITGQSTKQMWCVVSLASLVHLGLVVALNTVRVLAQSGWMMSTAKGERQCYLDVRSLVGKSKTVAMMRMLVWCATIRLVANKKSDLHQIVFCYKSFRGITMHELIVACSY